MAEVFVATDLQLRREVAVKRLPSSAMKDATAKARFAREARALARVNDQHVVTVFDIVVDDGRPFLIMELVDGTTLRDLVDAEGRLEPARVVSIASGICSGLAAVHARGIVHRDMKPSNVFLTTSGAVKIGDFGIASVASDVTVTRAGEVFGSAPYVSPEQVSGDPIDARADLYSLGCVMFEMATGRPPFAGDDPAALAYQHVHTKPERADALVTQVPPALASTIEGLMAKDPEDRPESADALRRSLEAMRLPAASDVGDVATQPLTPVAATDVLPVGPATDAAAAGLRDRRQPLPWIVGLVLGIILLLVLNAIYRWSRCRDPRLRSPAAAPVPIAGSRWPSVAPSPRSPTPSPPTSGSVEDATAALTGLVAGTRIIGSGRGASRRGSSSTGWTTSVARSSEGDTGKVVDALGGLQDKVDKGLDKGRSPPRTRSASTKPSRRSLRRSMGGPGRGWRRRRLTGCDDDAKEPGA